MIETGSAAAGSRYTRDGSDALEREIEALCRKVAEGVSRRVPAARLEGVLLGGGYGRGEGGVWRTPQGDRPYNDLEFYVFVRGGTSVPGLHELGEALTREAGIEVEFKRMSLARLRRSPPSMFYYDLVVGHRWTIGDEALLAGCGHHRDASKIPLHEATRLLMNRCCGLLFSRAKLQQPEFGGEAADYVGRNLSKAELAFGDVLLVACGQYHWSCLERGRRVQALAATGEWPWLAAIQACHAAGVAFKLHPVPSPATQEELRARHAALSELARQVWLWLESRRLGRSFASVRDYVECSCDKCPETAGWKNLLINARRHVLSARYPRGELLETLAAALWGAPAEQAVQAAQAGVVETLWRRFG